MPVMKENMIEVKLRDAKKVLLRAGYKQQGSGKGFVKIVGGESRFHIFLPNRDTVKMHFDFRVIRNKDNKTYHSSVNDKSLRKEIKRIKKYA
ncbi:MAG TPA: hypothetical protein ENI13_00085 [candidate division CPR3 bacterium]|uniref:Uncharacterized protein n=1 Tax=candidate division CPR3 bacterium TaxID=2268181 RepID=A0A7C1T1S3_UNCC3|nr:hypothetical protein [candidate division CPR3 bacterium]